jgi:hypothetical protein
MKLGIFNDLLTAKAILKMFQKCSRYVLQTLKLLCLVLDTSYHEYEISSTCTDVDDFCVPPAPDTYSLPVKKCSLPVIEN